MINLKQYKANYNMLYVAVKYAAALNNEFYNSMQQYKFLITGSLP